MGTMIKGTWTIGQDKPVGEQGRFERPTSTFRGRIGTSEHPAEAGRYLLYAMMGCPWAHRTLIVRAMLGLHDAIDVALTKPRPTMQDGWVFGETGTPFADPFGRRALHEVYADDGRGYTGRCTVPVLWDKERALIVNNESADIVRMFPRAFAQWATNPVDLYPAALVEQIDGFNNRIYKGLNNGVYRAGFAQTNEAHAEAVAEVFDTLDWLEEVLSDGRAFLCGAQITEADVRLCTTLFRFEAYREAFYCDIKGPEAHPHVWAYRERARRWPGVAETLLEPRIYLMGYASIPFAACNNPEIERHPRLAA